MPKEDAPAAPEEEPLVKDGKKDKAGKDDKKKKKKSDMKEVKFKANTLDAFILACSRLHHCSELGIWDILGYLLAILMHTLAISVQLFATYITFTGRVEKMEDPVEGDVYVKGVSVDEAFWGKSVGVITQALRQAIDGNLFLNETFVTSQIGWPGTNFTGVQTMVPLTVLEINAIKALCKQCMLDNSFVHQAFLLGFMGIVLTESMNLFWKMNVVWQLPADITTETKGETDELIDMADWKPEAIEDADQRYTLVTRHDDHYWVEDMNCFCKAFALTALLVHFFFLLLVFWTFAKMLALLHNILKIAKMSLKVGFLIKFITMVFDGFAGGNLKRILNEGGYKIPKKGAKAVDCGLCSSDEEDGFDFDYVWNTWLGAVVKFVIAALFTFIVSGVIFSQQATVIKLCKQYEEIPQFGTFYGLDGLRFSDRNITFETLF